MIEITGTIERQRKQKMSHSAIAEEGEVSEPPLPLLGKLIVWGEIHNLPPNAAVSPNSPWSMVAIRNHQDDGCNNPPIIFPPINHENLHIHDDNQQLSFSDSDSDSHSDSNSPSTFSPSDSSPVPHSPLFSNLRARPSADSVGWYDSWMEILKSKVHSLLRFFCSSFTSSRGVFLTFRSAAFTAILIAFLYFRGRRRLRAGEVNRDRLIGIIKERDEKINQLLDQISRMNQVLLALHRAPTSPTP